jgi:site-specific DNA-methyltransferase (adenine-specific)
MAKDLQIPEDSDRGGNFNMKKKKKRKYIPGLAAFYFEPDNSWNKKEAYNLYINNKKDYYGEIYYKDCIDGMKGLEDNSVDLIIADPPFGLEFNGKESLYNRDSELVSKGYVDVDGSEYRLFTKKWVSFLPRLMKKTASAFIFSGWTNLADVLQAIEECNLKLINHIIWKYQFGVFTKRKFVTSHYHLLWIVKNEKNYFFNKIKHYPLDIWEIPRKYASGEKKNGTKLPIELISRCIDYCSKPGQLVLDPFMGNGTTAVASKGNFRHFIGFEINEKMRTIIESNLEKVKIGELYMVCIVHLF